MGQFTPLQLSLQPFGLVVNPCCELDFKERATTIEIKTEPEQKLGREGAAKLLP